MSNYYDIDAILTDAQITDDAKKLPCAFGFEGPGLGFLDGNVGEDVKPGTRVDLPLWLASFLAVPTGPNAPALATLDVPAALSQRVVNALKADPKTVELRSQAQHFYSLGARVMELFEEEEMIDVLTDTFKKRAAEIADHAHNPRGAIGEGVDFLRGLDETERQLFRAAHDSSKAVKQWMANNKQN